MHHGSIVKLSVYHCNIPRYVSVSDGKPIRRWVHALEETGSTAMPHVVGRPRTATSSKNVVLMRAAVEQSQRLSAQGLAVALGKWWGQTNVKPLIGLHGWQDNANTWARLAPLLPPDISLLALDAPGHGLSSYFPQGIPYRISDQTFVILHVMNHYEWDKISLLGHSMGAVQSFVHTAAFPDQIENLIMIDAFKPVSIKPENDLEKLGANIDSYLEVEDCSDGVKPAYSYEDAIQRLHNGMIGQSLSKESCMVLLERGLEKSGDGYSFRRDRFLKVGRLGGWLHGHVLYMASCIKCNVLFIKADPGLVFESLKINSETLETLKVSAKIFQFNTVEGLHHVHLNNPETVAHIIINFLNFPGQGPSEISSVSLEQLSKKELLSFM